MNTATPETQTLQTVRFVGQKSLGWDNRNNSWVFIQHIDKTKIDVGTRITIARHHPLHQESLEPIQNPENPNAPARNNNTLLQGTIVGLSDVKEGEALYTVRDDTSKRLTSVRIPVSRTNINEDGGWTWMVKPLWGMSGPLLKFPTRVSRQDIWGPGAARTDKTPSGFAARDL